MKHYHAIRDRISNVNRDIWLFLLAVGIIGFSGQMIESTFNNFLNDTYKIGVLERGILEFPRELPGFSVAFVAALLFFLPGRRLAAFAMVLQAIGLILLAFYASSFSIMLVWLFIMSMGMHLFIALQNSIGMELAREGYEGRRLGQFSSIRNFTAIAGSFLVYIGFKYLHLTFSVTFAICAAVLLVAAVCFMAMTPMPVHRAGLHLKLHREYSLFYWLSVLYGTRKQIFITFAPWVLVTIYGKPTQVIAYFFTIGGIAGIFFQPLLGWVIDHLGERFVLAFEGVCLVFICLGYGFAKSVFPDGNTAYYIAATCFIFDMILISASMARATYLKKIAIHPSHVAPTLTMGVTIDHAFSIAISIICGFIWYKLGFQYVFLVGMFIAITYFFSVMAIRIPNNVKLRLKLNHK